MRRSPDTQPNMPRHIRAVTDATIAEVVAAERAALVLTHADCARCATFVADLEALLAVGQLAGVVVGALTLDEPAAARFKRDNHWLIGLEPLPCVLLYQRGTVVDLIGAAQGAQLAERVAAAFTRAAAAGRTAGQA
jgi:hypothetical protein